MSGVPDGAANGGVWDSTPPSSWRPRDCHAHTTWSDGALSPADLVRIAEARGVLPSITDHASRSASFGLQSADDVRRYLDDLETLVVARGAEFCWHDALWRELPDELTRRFTHRIGSLHAIPLDDGTLVHAFASHLPSGLQVDRYMDAHVAALQQFAREMPVDILAHPTLLPLPWRSRPLEELWTEAREERAVEALFRGGIAFEVSARYWPHERFVRRAVSRGVRLSLGSDGHSADQVAHVVPQLELTRRLDVPDQELYDPFVHGSKTMTHATR